MASGEVVIQSMWSPAVTAVRTKGIPCVFQPLKEGYRAWAAGFGLPATLSGKKLDGAYEFINWFLDGWAGAYLNRQGYYSAVLETAKAKMEAYEWAYWMEGKAATQDIKSPERRPAGQGGQHPRRWLVRAAHGRHRLLERADGREHLHGPEVERVRGRLMAPPRSACGAPPQGGAASGPAKPDPRRPLECWPGCAGHSSLRSGGLKVSSLKAGPPAWLQALPFAAVFAFFFIAPLLLIGAVSFWPTSDYELIPGFTGQNYVSIFEGCANLAEPCVTLKTYWSTLRFSLLTWARLAAAGLHDRLLPRLPRAQRRHADGAVRDLHHSVLDQQRHPHDLVGAAAGPQRAGQPGADGLGIVEQPVEWLLFSEFSVVLAFVHLYTMFMLVPIFNSMMRIDRSLLEAAEDAGASAWQTLWNVIVPLSRTGIVIGSIFVITIVMGDFVTVGVMGGQQIASVGKVIQVQTSYLQFPLAAANAVVLLAVVLMIIVALTRMVDLRKEL